MNTLLKIQLVLFFICTISKAQTFIWPFDPQTSQANITGTVGELRSSSRYHKGFDCTKNGMSATTPVKAVKSGVITAINRYSLTPGQCFAYIAIDNLYYIHTIAKAGLLVGHPITVGDIIGYPSPMFVNGVNVCEDMSIHTHIQQGETSSPNPTPNLLPLITPYIDNCVPTITDAFIYFDPITRLKTTPNTNPGICTTKLLNNISHKWVYNKVDFVAHVRDQKTSTNGSCNGNNLMPNSTKFLLLDKNGTTVYGPIENYNFKTTPKNESVRFNMTFTNDASSSKHKIILTNSPLTTTSQDRYFNAGLKKGITYSNETWVNDKAQDAVEPQDAKFPEGNYTLRIITSDTSYNNSKTSANYDVPIIIDNFLPWVDSVYIKSGGVKKYQSYWNWNGTQNSFVKDSCFLDGSTFASLWAFTSEPMDSMVISIPSLEIGDTVMIPTDAKRTKWFFNIEKTKIEKAIQNKHKIIFHGKDYAQNNLIKIPKQIGIHQKKNTWVPILAVGSDENHFIYTCIVNKNAQQLNCGVSIISELIVTPGNPSKISGCSTTPVGYGEDQFKIIKNTTGDSILIAVELLSPQQASWGCERSLRIQVFDSCSGNNCLAYDSRVEYDCNSDGITCQRGQESAMRLVIANKPAGEYFILISGINVGYKLTAFWGECNGGRIPDFGGINKNVICKSNTNIFVGATLNWGQVTNATNYRIWAGQDNYGPQIKKGFEISYDWGGISNTCPLADSIFSLSVFDSIYVIATNGFYSNIAGISISNPCDTAKALDGICNCYTSYQPYGCYRSIDTIISNNNYYTFFPNKPSAIKLYNLPDLTLSKNITLSSSNNVIEAGNTCSVYIDSAKYFPTIDWIYFGPNNYSLIEVKFPGINKYVYGIKSNWNWSKGVFYQCNCTPFPQKLTVLSDTFNFLGLKANSDHLKVYYNNDDGNIYFKTSLNIIYGSINIAIYNTLGQLEKHISKPFETEFSVFAQLSPGIYFASISIDRIQYSYKFLVR